MTGLKTGSIYRFRYRAINAVGHSGWSPITYIQPASVPTTPQPPTYAVSTDTSITLHLHRSDFDGGLPILDYELWIDQGSPTSSFTKMGSYSYATHGMSFVVDRDENSLTPGLIYRFIFRSKNAIGYSAFSDNLRIGLGALPPQAGIVSRASSGNSPSSIGLQWSPLVSTVLPIIEYRLYMDDGNGVIFSLIFRGIDLDFTAAGLTPGVTYSFKLSAVNFNGEGPLSSAVLLQSCVVPIGVL